MSNFKGYSLFEDIEDRDLRIRNRAAVMANMYEDNPDAANKDSTSNKGALMIFGYMERIPAEERAETVVAFHKTMESRGYRSVA